MTKSEIIALLEDLMQIEADDENLEIIKPARASDNSRGWIVKFSNDDCDEFFFKTYPPETADNIESFISACKNHKLDDWHVPQILHYGKMSDCVFTIEEAIPGRTLFDKLRDNKLNDTIPGASLFEFILIMIKLVIELEKLHSADIVHADVKPENIQITPLGEVYLLDFDTIYFVKNGSKAIRLSSDGYSAPFRKDGTRIPKDDIYSVGKIIQDGLVINCNVNTNLKRRLTKIIEICCADDCDRRCADKALIEELKKIGIQHITESYLDELKTSGATVISPNNSDSKSIEHEMKALGIKDCGTINYIIKLKNHRRIGFTEDGIYVKHNTVGKKIEHVINDEPSFIDFSKVLCLHECIQKSNKNGLKAHVVQLSSDEDFRVFKINCQGIDISKLKNLITDIVVLRENLFSSVDIEKYYTDKCKAADRLFGDYMAKRDFEEMLDAVVALGETAGESFCYDILKHRYKDAVTYYENQKNRKKVEVYNIKYAKLTKEYENVAE